MTLPDKAVTLVEFLEMINLFLSNECEKKPDHLIHKKCGGGIRIGFMGLFYANTDGLIDLGDGFGIGFKKIPYCENCNPPDGFGHKFTRRILIKRNP